MKTLIFGTGVVKLPVWLAIMLLRWNFRRNKSIQRYSVHATSAGNSQEKKVFHGRMLTTADEPGLNVPHLQSPGIYLRSI